MVNDSENKWYVIYTKPRHEKKVVKFLSDKGINNYCPLIKTLKQWSDRKKKVEEPLFKSYVFVNISDRQYYETLNTPGVVRYISFEGKAVSIPDKQIELIKNTINSNLHLEVTTENFSKGELVEIKEGPLSGIKGEIIQNNGKSHLLIRINHTEYSLIVHTEPGILTKL